MHASNAASRTPMFDSWTHDDFAQHVYNADYPRHDPEYLEIRPQQHADLICTSFPEMREGRVLDFGSGLGLLERKLASRGFADVTSYDPFSHPVPPEGSFDTILSFEVFEHHQAPVDLRPDHAPPEARRRAAVPDVADHPGHPRSRHRSVVVLRAAQRAHLVSHRPVPDAACPTPRAEYGAFGSSLHRRSIARRHRAGSTNSSSSSGPAAIRQATNTARIHAARHRPAPLGAPSCSTHLRQQAANVGTAGATASARSLNTTGTPPVSAGSSGDRAATRRRAARRATPARPPHAAGRS